MSEHVRFASQPVAAPDSRNITLGDLYVQCLTTYGKQIAVIDRDRGMTYAELADRVARVIAFLAANDIGNGDRLGLAVRMGTDFLACYMACHIAGIAVADMPPNLGLSALRHRVFAGDLDALVIEPVGMGGTEVAQEFIASIAPDVQVISTDSLPGVLHLDACRDMAPAPLVARPAPEYAAITFTGGSTGLPKAIGYNGEAGARLTMAHMASLPYPASPVSVVYRTSFAVLTYNVQPTLLRGGTLVTLPDFDLDELARLAALHNANMLYMSVQAIYDLVDRQDLTLPKEHLKMVFYGGEAILPGRLGMIVDRLGPILVGSYGCSEATPSVLLRPEDHDVERPHLLSSLGRAVLGAKVEIRDKAGCAVPCGEYGEITIWSPSRMVHYLNDPVKTAETMTDGWVRTGDVGRMDENGYLYMLDRLAFSFEVDGKTIYPRAIDLAMADHPAVLAAATIAVEPAGRQQVCVCVVPRKEARVSETELHDFLRSAVPAVRIDHILIMPDLPKFPANFKIDRQALSAIVMKRLGQ